MSIKRIGKGASPSPSLTAAQLQEYLDVLKRFSENRWIVPSIIAAGAAALLESTHILWLFIKFLIRFVLSGANIRAI